MRKKKSSSYETPTDAELDIMKALWKHKEPVRISEIIEELSDSRSWKSQTVHVLGTRLEKKGLISIDKSNCFHTYSPLIDENEYMRMESKALIDRTKCTVGKLVASLIDADGITDEDVAQLEDILHSKRHR